MKLLEKGGKFIWMFFKNFNYFVSLILIVLRDESMPEILFELIKFMFSLWRSEEVIFRLYELQIDMDKEVEFLALTHLPKMVHIDTINEDVLLLGKLTIVEVNFGCFGGEDFILKVGLSDEVKVLVGECFYEMGCVIEQVLDD